MKLLYSGCDAVQFGTQMVTIRWKETNAYIFCHDLGGSTFFEALLPFFQTIRNHTGKNRNFYNHLHEKPHMQCIYKTVEINFFKEPVWCGFTCDTL